MRWTLSALLLAVAGALILGAVAFQVQPLAAQGATLRVAAPDTAVSVPQPFDVHVNIDGATDLAAFEFDVVYDRNLLELTGITVAPYVGATQNCNANAQRCAAPLGPLEVAPGRKSVGGYTYGTGAGANGSGLVASLRFRPLAPGTSTISLASVLLTDTRANPSTPGIVADTVTIREASSRTYLPLIFRTAR